jgi:hypothetical protein
METASQSTTQQLEPTQLCWGCPLPPLNPQPLPSPYLALTVASFAWCSHFFSLLRIGCRLLRMMIDGFGISFSSPSLWVKIDL